MPFVWHRRRFAGTGTDGCMRSLLVLNAEGVYRVLKEEQLEPKRLERLAAEFLVDDHSFWDLPGIPEDSHGAPDAVEQQPGKGADRDGDHGKSAG